MCYLPTNSTIIHNNVFIFNAIMERRKLLYLYCNTVFMKLTSVWTTVMYFFNIKHKLLQYLNFHDITDM